MASPLIGVSGQAASQVRALEKSLGLDASKADAAEDASQARRGTKASPLKTAREVAQAFGCNIRTVAKWVDEGMPVAQRGTGGRPSLFDLQAIERWKVARDTAAPGEPGSANTARMRKEMAQALEAEQRIAIKAKTLVLRADMEQVMADEYTRCRTKLLGLPRKAKAVLPHLSATDVMALDVLIREALEDLASA